VLVSPYVALVLGFGFSAVTATAATVRYISRNHFLWRVYDKGGPDDLEVAGDVLQAIEEQPRTVIVVPTDLRRGHRGDGNVNQHRVGSNINDHDFPSSEKVPRSLPAMTPRKRKLRKK